MTGHILSMENDIKLDPTRAWDIIEFDNQMPSLAWTRAFSPCSMATGINVIHNR